METINVRTRLKTFLKYIKVSEGSFENQCGLANGFVSHVGDSIRKASLQKILNVFPDLNEKWLITGVGTMLKDGNQAEEKKENEDNTINYRLVPLMNIDSVGGMHSGNTEIDTSEYIRGMIPFTEAKEGDICIMESGNSMYPTIPSGSLLLIREVPTWKEYIGYGNIFVILLKDGRRITKEITRYDEDPKNYVLCVSHNERVPAEELPKSMIVGVWKVIKIQIDRGW